MANILLITDYYPPIKSVASNRTEAFAQYLTEFGHKVFVITAGHEDEVELGVIDVYRYEDKRTVKLLDTNIVESKYIHYAKCIYNIIVSSFLLYSNGWVEDVVHCGYKLCENEKIDVMITSFPTIGSMVAGLRIKEQFSSVKWIADMRDSIWTPENNAITRRRLHNLTKNCLKQVDSVTSVSSVQMQAYKNAFGKPAMVVMNGYNFKIEKIVNYTKTEKFTIVYTGNFYGARSPENFLTACKSLKIRGVVPELECEIIGNHSVVNLDYELEKFVHLIDRMEYLDLVKYCRSKADLLLLVIPKSNEKGVYTGKLFDYIGMGKPILGLVPLNDVAAELITETGNSYLAENEDVEEIKEQILVAYKDWQMDRRNPPNFDLIQRCHRRNSVRQIDEVIKRMIN